MPWSSTAWAERMHTRRSSPSSRWATRPSGCRTSRHPNNHFSPESLGGTTVRLLLIDQDPQSVIDRAEALGATVIQPAERAHGWLLGRIEDPFGHHWEIGTPLVEWPPRDSP